MVVDTVFLPDNRIYTLLSMFSASLFANIQMQTFTNSAFITFKRLNSLQSDRYILVSSVNKLNSNRLLDLKMLLMNIKNSKVPEIEPCGTPIPIEEVEEFVLLAVLYGCKVSK